MSVTEPLKKKFSPRKSLREWNGFVHLLARFYMNYRGAIFTAAKRSKNRSIDIDVQPSAEGTMWALHWGDVGKNKLQDPEGLIKPSERISNLTDLQIDRLRSLDGKKKPHTIQSLIDLANGLGVRVELELKALVKEWVIRKLLASHSGSEMNGRGDLQFKTLAAIPGAVHRLKEAYNAGGTTILSFTNYHEPGINKEYAWPVTDYTRGHAKWI